MEELATISTVFSSQRGLLETKVIKTLNHMNESESEGRSVGSNSLQPHGLYSPWNSMEQNTGVSSFSLLQGIFPTQGLNPGLPHFRQLLYQLNHRGSPRILEWVAHPFSNVSFWPRIWTRVSYIAGKFFYQLSYQGIPHIIKIKHLKL